MAQLAKGVWHRYGHWWPWGAVAVAVVLVLVAVGWWQEGAERDERLARLRLSLEQIDALSPVAFELAVRDLMVRDGIASRHVGQAMSGGCPAQSRSRSYVRDQGLDLRDFQTK